MVLNSYLKNQPLNSLFNSIKLNQKVNYYDLLLKELIKSP